jgi:hypothetical protein
VWGEPGSALGTQAAASNAAASSTATNTQIRLWAQAHGIAVASRGRIAASVVDADWAANPA